MKTKHTPGLWFYQKHEHAEYGDPELCSHTVIRADEPCVHLATIISDCVGESEANARLIAAAPELLEALQSALCALEVCGKSYDHTMDKARAAIRKALGEEK